MKKKIIGANRTKVRNIEMDLPVDLNGEYAFDEDGDPIKGKTPVTVTVQRFDCMNRDQIKALTAALAEVEELKDDEGNPLDSREKGIQTVLAMIRPYVDSQVLEVMGNLSPFEVEQIAEAWQEGSAMSVGELLASTNS